MKKRGQVWVETVIYTLIAFVMIGAVLAYAKPKIEEMQDKAIIEKTIGMMEELNGVILSLDQGGAGNKRIVDIGISKGEIEIDGANNKMAFKIESKNTYSQPGENIAVGNLIAKTEKRGKLNIITLTMDYSGKYDLTYNELDSVKILTKSSTLYKISVSNKGKNNNETQMDFDIN